MLLPYRQLECNTLEDIQSQTLAWINQHYDLTDAAFLNSTLWEKLDTVSLLKASPALLSWTRSLGLRISELSMTVVNGPIGIDLHIDEMPVTAKINIPVLNYQHAINEWYHISQATLDRIGTRLNQFGSEVYNLSTIDIATLTKLDAIQMTGPIVFNSRIPHRVVCKPGALFPRVILACMFFNEPLEFLKS